MSSASEIVVLAETLRNIVADANAKVGWKEYAEHIRKGGADDLAARVSMDIAHKAYLAGRDSVPRGEIIFRSIGVVHGLFLILRPSSRDPNKPWALQLRYHENLGETEYCTLAWVTDETAREIIKAGEPFWLFGDPDKQMK